jgi:hypothetical protein
MNDMLKRWLYAVLVCLLGVPVAIYVLGGLIVGPYEGERGLIGMMGTIYVDALTGHVSTWIMLLAPALLVAIWLGCIKLRRSLPR